MKRGNRIVGFLLIGAAGVFSGSLLHAGESGIVEVVPPKTGEFWIGQRAGFSIELLSKGQSSGSARFDLPKVPGAIMMAVSERPLLTTREVEDESYTVQTHDFAVFAQQAGDLTIPAITVRFGSKAGFGQPVEDHRLATSAFGLKIKAPPGLVPGEVAVSSSGLTATETWTPKVNSAKVGDAFTRTITMVATDVPGMLLPELSLPAIEGLPAYPKPPQIGDRTGRGEFTGERVESTTYVSEVAGKFEIPELVIRWWNPDSESWQEKRFPSVALNVAMNPDLAAAGESAATERHPVGWITVASTLIAAVFLGPSFVRHYRRWWQDRGASEAGQFRRLIAACRASDAVATDRALGAWLARFGLKSPDLTRAESSSPNLRGSLLGLQEYMAGISPDWNGKALPTGLKNLRRRLLSNKTLASSLVPLNPKPSHIP